MERPEHFPELFIGSVYNGHQRWHGDHGRFIKKSLATEMMEHYLAHGLTDEQLAGMAIVEPSPEAAAPEPRMTIFERIEQATQAIREKYLSEEIGHTAVAQMVDLDSERRRRRGVTPEGPEDLPLAVGAEQLSSNQLYIVGNRVVGEGRFRVLSGQHVRVMAGGENPLVIRSAVGPDDDEGGSTVTTTHIPRTGRRVATVGTPGVAPMATDIDPPRTYVGTAEEAPPDVIDSTSTEEETVITETHTERPRRRKGLIGIMAAGVLAVAGLAWWGSERHDSEPRDSAPATAAPREATPQGPAAPPSTVAEPQVTVPPEVKNAGDEISDSVNEAADEAEDITDDEAREAGDDVLDAANDALEARDDEMPEPEPYEAPQPEPRIEFLERDDVVVVPVTVPVPVLVPSEPEVIPGPVVEVALPPAPAERVSPPPAPEVVPEPVAAVAPEPAPAPDTVIPTFDRPTEVGEITYVKLSSWPWHNAQVLWAGNRTNDYTQFALDVYNWTQHRHFVWDHSNGMFWENGRVMNPGEMHVYNNGMADIFELGFEAPHYN